MLRRNARPALVSSGRDSLHWVEDWMTLRRLFHVLVLGAGALMTACATTSAGPQSGERLPDGGVATPPPAPPVQQSGAPSGW